MEFDYQASTYLSDISVHTSYVECDPMTEREKARYKLSIHASHAGCDLVRGPMLAPSSPFQSTHPMRDATLLLSAATFPSAFQSTHPMRDATTAVRKFRNQLLFQSTHPMRDATDHMSWSTGCILLSIHASHAGCDRILTAIADWWRPFNPRIPCGMRLRDAVHVWVVQDFQSTHPMRDATLIAIVSLNFMAFNPRIPCGMRLTLLCWR